MRQHLANLPDEDLAYLSEGSPNFASYVDAVDWAQRYAKANRELDAAVLALHPWPTELSVLRLLKLPSERAVSELLKRAQDLESRRRTGAAQGTELSAAVRAGASGMPNSSRP